MFAPFTVNGYPAHRRDEVRLNVMAALTMSLLHRTGFSSDFYNLKSCAWNPESRPKGYGNWPWKGRISNLNWSNCARSGVACFTACACFPDMCVNQRALNPKFRSLQGDGECICRTARCGAWRFGGHRLNVRVKCARRKNDAMALRSDGPQKAADASSSCDVSGLLSSIGDFTRFRDNGSDGTELQTAIITYRKPFPWSVFDKRQVDLVAAVHIADKKYFTTLQEELASYDRVLYEMVADKNPRQTNRNSKYRWRPPKRRPGRSRSFSIIGSIQRIMASILTLDFQLNCMDYRQDNWFHADLDYETFRALQEERGETFFTFARDLTDIWSKTIVRNLQPNENLDPWRSKLLWASRVVPMPLIALFVIEGVCAPSDSPLSKSPEMKALLEFDLASALKVFLAKQISLDFTDGASSVVENSVIIGERNRAAMYELQEALRDGCSKVAVFYGSGHLPDMDSRLQKDFGLQPTEIQWRTAWSINGGREIRQDAFADILGTLAKLSGWPLNRYQTLALIFLSAALAVDLYFWELVLGAINDYAQQTIVAVGSILEQGWGL